jgi:hypothetical protein
MEDGLGRWKKEGETRGTNLHVPKVKREENDHDDDLLIYERPTLSQENLSNVSNESRRLTLKT